MMEVLIASLSFGVLAGTYLVTKGGPENSLIGLNAASICAVTALVAFDKIGEPLFSKDIALYLIFPGIFGAILFSRFVGAAKND